MWGEDVQRNTLQEFFYELEFTEHTENFNKLGFQLTILYDYGETCKRTMSAKRPKEVRKSYSSSFEHWRFQKSVHTLDLEMFYSYGQLLR